MSVGVDATRSVLERCLEDLLAFPCPSHHRVYWERTRQALHYLLEPAQMERIVFLRNSTFAPICAELVADSGVAFLRGIPEGPKDLASNMEQAASPADALVARLWDQTLGMDFEDWRPLADRSPVIFVRLGKSEQNAAGRWQWALLADSHLDQAYPDIHAAFAGLIARAEQEGNAEQAERLTWLQSGILP